MSNSIYLYQYRRCCQCTDFYQSATREVATKIFLSGFPDLFVILYRCYIYGHHHNVIHNTPGCCYQQLDFFKNYLRLFVFIFTFNSNLILRPGR